MLCSSNPPVKSAIRGLLAGLALVGCVDESVPSGPVLAEVVVVGDVDPDSGTTRFELGTRELRTLKNLGNLQFQNFQVWRGGTITARDIDGDTVVGGRFEDGERASLRYRVENGAVRGRDYSSTIMLSAASAMETAMASMTDLVGVSIDDLVAEHGPFEILFEPVIRTRAGAGGSRIRMKANAFYLARAHQFGLARRSGKENVPLAANPVVLGHEFGHALFEFLFWGGLSPDCKTSTDPHAWLEEQFSMNGLNEGFADFFAFAHTGATNPLFGAFNDAGEQVAVRGMVGPEFAFKDIKAENVCKQSYYCVGILFSRSLYQAFLDLDNDPRDPAARTEFFREVASALQATRASMVASPQLDKLQPSDPCNPFENISEADAIVAGTFLASFAENLPVATRNQVCKQFKNRFGEEGFPATVQGVCR